MCGIVGLHLRTPELFGDLGTLLTGMLCEMGDRGSDSAGVAVYGDPVWSPPGKACASVLDIADDASVTAERIGALLEAQVTVIPIGDTYQFVTEATAESLVAAIKSAYSEALVAGFGTELAVLKGVGHPRVLAEKWQLPKAQGWQGVGHTRMATESAVTPSGAHPYAVGPDQCLVHNGSFSNYATIRRTLTAAGAQFDSENDTEVGARFIADQLAWGRDVETSLKELCSTFDGFYTLLVSNRDSFAVVRDAIACKPAVVAETPDWVAMASEYRAFVGLPGVENAAIWEPEPEVVYAWNRRP
jgi:methylamine---glutamate N-methyltransferase subunit A